MHIVLHIIDIFFIRIRIFQIKHKTDPFDVIVCGDGAANRKEVQVDYAQGTVKIFFDAKGPCAPEGNYLPMTMTPHAAATNCCICGLEKKYIKKNFSSLSSSKITLMLNCGLYAVLRKRIRRPVM